MDGQATLHRPAAARALLVTRLDVTAGTVGLICALNGLLFLFVPALLIYAYRSRAFWRTGIVLALAFALGMTPFFPAALSAWGYRAERSALPTPFWFSVYSLLPDGWYQPTFDKLLLLGLGALATAGYWLKRITLQDALVISVAAIAFSGVYASAERVLPVLIVLFACCKRVPRLRVLVFAILLMLYIPLGQLTADGIERWHIALFWLPVAFTCFLYARHATR